MSGRKIADRYELVSELGEGGMGVVWRARDTRLGRAVAVKLLSASSVGNDVARARLIREARAAAAFEHEGIVRVYDVGEIDDGGAYLVMELIRGASLRALLERTGDESLTIAARVRAIIESARALQAAHDAGIVHRDVKPDNIMIRDNGRVTVVDFGVAKPVATEIVVNAETLAGISSTNLTGAGQLVGTPAYLAPEQARGGEIGPATDQFALAVTAFEALTGKLPWKGGGVIEVVAALLRDDSPPISSEAPVPPAFDPIFQRALSKEPKDRYPSIGAFADALEVAEASLEGAPSGKGRAATAVLAEASKTTGPAPTPIKIAEISSTKISAVTDDAKVVSSPVPPPAKSKLPMIVGAAVIIVIGGGILASQARRSTDVPNANPGAAAAGPLLFACPPLDVAESEDAWLGVAPAALACERLQLAHGGLDARTAPPAELLDAARNLTEGAQVLPLDGKDTRSRAVAAAKQRGTRWVDGTITRTSPGFAVELVLRRPDGAEIARGTGRGVEIFEAVRGALGPILAADPTTKDELAMLRESLDVGSVDEVLALHDIRSGVLIEDLVSLADVCATFEKRTDSSPRVRYLAKVTCLRKLRTGTVTEAPPAIDESSASALITTSLAQGTNGGPDAVRGRAARLEKEIEKAPSAEMRSRLAAAAGEIYNLVSDPHTGALTRTAIQASPKAYDWRTSMWHRLAFSSQGTGIARAAMPTWQPWEPVGQSLAAAGQILIKPEDVQRSLRRSYMLCQRGFYATNWGKNLIEHGKTDVAQVIADTSDDDLLRVQILNGSAKYKQALETVPRMLAKLPADDASASLAFRLAHEGVIASMTLEKPASFVDDIVTRFVESDPPHVIDGVIPFLALTSACCFAPKTVGKRCIDRIQKLRTDKKLPTIFTDADTVLEGAARFVDGDSVGATKAWRTMLRAPGWIQEPLRDPLATAFDRAGSPELGDEIDLQPLGTIDEPRSAELSWVRVARRAYKKGDKDRGKKIAGQVVDKWRFADEDPPSLKEMRDLLAKP